MEDHRKQELLKRWPAPWVDAVLDGTVFLGPVSQIVNRRPIIFRVSGQDAENLATLLVEAFNAHFGQPRQALDDLHAIMSVLSPTFERLPAIEEVVERLRTWKRDSEELAEIRARGSAGKAVAFDLIARICSLGENEPLANAATQVRTWKAKAAELDAIRAETEDQSISPEIQRAFDDLARQDCARAAATLGRILGWSAMTAKLAGELIFSELRNREAAAQVETQNDIPSPFNWEPCASILSSSTHVCVLPKGHAGQHASKRMAW